MGPFKIDVTSEGREGGQHKRWLRLLQIANSIVFTVTWEGGRCVERVIFAVTSFLNGPYMSFQGSGMGKVEDNLTSADPLMSYTT